MAPRQRPYYSGTWDKRDVKEWSWVEGMCELENGKLEPSGPSNRQIRDDWLRAA
ncbi:hypothetical protein M433DRAFT_9133 [Acidomyces richmondensis BFW]|nr:hypothetical protein M433DRAFT_9133 [Acidomyces richmondensis BFW]